MEFLKPPKHLPADSLVPRIYALFDIKRRHLLIGEVALETGYRLELVEWQLEELVQSGSLVRLTDDEKRAACLHPLVVAYRRA